MSLSSVVIQYCLRWPHADTFKYIGIALSLIRLVVLMAAGVAAELAVADVAASHLQLRLPAVHAPDTAWDLEPHASGA